MFNGRGKISFILVGTALLANMAYSQQNLSIRSDTVYFDTIVDNKSQVYRKIIIYDTLWLTDRLPARKAGLMSLLTDPPRFVLPATKIEAPFTYQPWIETGISYYFNNSFVNKSLLNKKESYQNTTGFGAYVNAFIPYENFYVRSGLNMSYFRTEIDGAYKISELDSTISHIPSTYDSVIIDTAYFLDTDQLPDTVYVMHVDTFNMTIYDTVRQVDCDTSSVNKSLHFTNRYFYLEMPFLFGYNFIFRPFELALESGFYLTWLARVRGKVINRSHFLKQLDDKYFHRVNFDAALRFRLKYNISSSKAITFSPGIRYSLFSIYRNDQIVARRNLRFGVALGYIFY